MKRWLSLAALAVLATGIVGCNDSDDSSDTNATTAVAVAATAVEFIGMEAPSNIADMSRSFSTAKARVTQVLQSLLIIHLST